MTAKPGCYFAVFQSNSVTFVTHPLPTPSFESQIHRGDTMETNIDTEQARVFIETWGPRLLAAVAILIVTWILAKAIRWAFAKAVDRIPMLQRAGGSGESVGSSLGKSFRCWSG